jgi:hypothetical protein
MVMQAQVEFTCRDHSESDDCPDALINYSENFREYGLRIHDGGSSSMAINFYPWCGAKLPDSLRNRWFEELAVLGFDDPWSQDIPAAFRTGAWYGAAA